MISLEKLRAVTHIVVHGKCADGMASAMILHDALPKAKVSYVVHNTKEHLEMPAEPGMLFCDFVPHESRAEEFVEAGTIVLDHHKHAKDLVAKFGANGVFADEKADRGVSGALLAFKEVWLPLAQDETAEKAAQALGMFPRPHILQEEIVRDFATLVGVRDTWQRQDPRWEEACAQSAAIGFWPEEELLASPPRGWASKLQLGKFLYERQLKSAKKAADNSYDFVTRKGTHVLVFEGTRKSSDAAEYIGQGADIVIAFATFVEDEEPTVIFSTRSHTGYDVGKMCKSYGGGGHTAAAGYTFKMATKDKEHRPLKWWESVLFNLLFRTPPGYVTVPSGRLHPFYLAERLVRQYEGE